MKKYETPEDAIKRRLSDLEADLHIMVTAKFKALRRDILMCKRCGQVTIGDRGTKKYCSDICRAEANK